jgi:ABC-type transport system involved in multi-copper enzyme maturation permease subunit
MRGRRLTETLSAYGKLLHLSLKLTFSARYVYCVAGIVVWFIVVALWNYGQPPQERLTGDDILNVVLTFPGVPFVILFGMQLVLFERENRTIEVMFCLPGPSFKVWVVKWIGLLAAVASAMGLQAVLAYFFLADFPFLETVFFSLFPLFFFASLTVFLSILFRSANAAAILAVVLAFLSWPFLRPFRRIDPFLNPLKPPADLGPGMWFPICFQNRLFLSLASAALFLLSLHLLGKRERLL